MKIVGTKKYYSLFSWIEARNLKPINKKPIEFHEKIVFLMFDGRMEQAGLADNLRAAASIYYLCKSLNIKFKIVFNYPFKLENYLEPNTYNWIHDKEDQTYLSSHAEDIVSISYRDVFLESNVNLQKEYIESKLKCSSSIIRLYTNTYCFDNFFTESYKELFKPTKILANLIEEQLAIIGGEFISISFRFANLLGDIKDTYGKELPDIEKSEIISKCLSAIDQIYQSHNCSKILITSDSSSFLEEAKKKRKFVHIIPGKTGHVGHEGAPNIVVKTFLDLYVISHANEIYMVRTPNMYRSGFAQRAAMIGNKPFKEVIL